jgi:hypothetical protein
MPVVYVDSASTDGSRDVARSLEAEVVELDMSLPFSAARGRNEGFARLLKLAPGVRFVQFVDGDCEVVEGWLDGAVTELEARTEAAVVCGRRRERHAERSVYNRLADLEWETPVGEARSCGGDAMMRVEAFQQVGGFDPSVAAGEEPELCQRLREEGWKVYRVDAEMTVHDAAMLRFGQWWRRAVRSGYGAMDVVSRFRRGRGGEGLFVKQVRSARIWAISWPAAVIVVGAALTLIAGPTVGAAGAALVLAALPLQVVRLAVRTRQRVGDWRTAFAYGILMMAGKWAGLVGQIRYRLDRAAGRNTRLIDYKGVPSTAATEPKLAASPGA